LKLGLNSTPVVVKQPLKFIEIESLKGRLILGSFLPQYFMKAILAGEMALAL
jgi:hypothetical protein